MPAKKKSGKAAGGGATTTTADDYDDEMAFLDAQIAANTDGAPKPQAAPEPTAKVEDADDGKDVDHDEDEADAAKKDKKKKKKKGAAKKDAEESAAPAAAAAAAPKSAQARAYLERQQKLKEEEERVRRLQEELDRKAREEEERIAAEERAIEEEKERKRKAKEDKKAAQKAAGTYMTKAEKEKKRRQEESRRRMEESGMLPLKDAAAAAGKQSDMYKKTGKAKVANASDSTTDAPVATPAPAPAPREAPAAAAPPAAAATGDAGAAGGAGAVREAWDDGDGDDDDDDWEVNIDKIDLSVQSRKEHVEADVEDLLELEKRKEQENLKQRGIELAKREEEQRLKREAEEQMRMEMERKEREAAMRKETSRRSRIARDEAARNARSPNNLRAPISCIMGHVDTGKTSLLDKIRHTNVQEGEAGGITQQIGVTQFSKETLAAQTQCLQEKSPFEIDLPGLLVIDTPGHESFTNLRSRGSSLCDIAILVIDLMHTLEPQTIESINLLKKSRTPFIVALNKIDRCYGWKATPNAPVRDSLKNQDQNCLLEFKDRTERAIVALMEQGLNAKLYWENDDPAHTVSLVPTSAITGEGVPDILMMLITLTQTRLRDQLMYMELLQCTVLEVKVIEGLGHTVDVVLVNGTLKEGDTIVLSTMDGPVVSTIRALLTPPPSREMRVKSEYLHHSSISGAIGVKIVAPDVGRVIAGTSVLVVQAEDDLEDVKEDVQTDIAKVQKALQTDNKGVMVHASTLGALEALMQFLREECNPPIPVSHVNIGPIHKKDVMRAAIMHTKQLPEFATILAFDCSVDAEAREMAEEENVRIFTADIIYHLFDQFTSYMARLREERKKQAQEVVMFPVVLKILPQYIFNKKDPIVIGVEVIEGTLRPNTLLCVPQLNLDIGRVTRMEVNHKEVQAAKKSTQCSIRIANESNPTLYYGRQFDHTHTLYSRISRASINACKEFFQDEMTKEDWQLIVKLKKVFNIT